MSFLYRRILLCLAVFSCFSSALAAESVSFKLPTRTNPLSAVLYHDGDSLGVFRDGLSIAHQDLQVSGISPLFDLKLIRHYTTAAGFISTNPVGIDSSNSLTVINSRLVNPYKYKDPDGRTIRAC